MHRATYVPARRGQEAGAEQHRAQGRLLAPFPRRRTRDAQRATLAVSSPVVPARTTDGPSTGGAHGDDVPTAHRARRRAIGLAGRDAAARRPARRRHRGRAAPGAADRPPPPRARARPHVGGVALPALPDADAALHAVAAALPHRGGPARPRRVGGVRARGGRLGGRGRRPLRAARRGADERRVRPHRRRRLPGARARRAAPRHPRPPRRVARPLGGGVVGAELPVAPLPARLLADGVRRALHRLLAGGPPERGTTVGIAPPSTHQ